MGFSKQLRKEEELYMSEENKALRGHGGCRCRAIRCGLGLESIEERRGAESPVPILVDS